MKNKQYYITTPLYYVNGEPHIGHAYTTILADVMARYQRMFGREVHFLTGLDEHGQKVADAAAQQNISPQQHCDDMAITWKSTWKKLHIQYDDLIRTTEERHIRVVTDILSRLHNKGDIYMKEYEGWYSVFEEQYFTEKDLVNGKDPIGGRPVELRRENNYFFRLSKYQDWLIEHYEVKGRVIPESRLNEVRGFLRQGLNDLCISRPKSRLGWGVPIPWDADFVTWVWFDALINYYSATLTPPDGSAVSWPADYHFIGKDILTTHAVYWVAMAHAAGLESPLKILAHGWWMGRDEGKISKSSADGINPIELAAKYGTDQLRYSLMREMTVGQDAFYNEESIVRRINIDLANDLGNLYSRLAKVWQSGGYAPAEVLADVPAGIPDELGEKKQVMKYHVQFEIEQIRPNAAIEHVFKLVRGLNQLIEQVKPWKAVKTDPASIVDILTWALMAVGEIAEMLEPVMPTKMADLRQWLYDNKGRIDPTAGKQLFPRLKLEKTQKKHLSSIKQNHARDPVVGLDSKQLINQPTRKKGNPNRNPNNINFRQIIIQLRTDLGELMGLVPPKISMPMFAKLVGVQNKTAYDWLSKSRIPNHNAQRKLIQLRRQIDEDPFLIDILNGEITSSDFEKVELRAGKVVACEKHPTADRLLLLTVDVGVDQRQIVAGIAEAYTSGELIGRSVIVVTNLLSASIRGEKSKGMLLAIGKGVNLKVIFLDDDVEPGSKVH